MRLWYCPLEEFICSHIHRCRPRLPYSFYRGQFLNGLRLIPLLCANQLELQCPLATAERSKDVYYIAGIHSVFVSSLFSFRLYGAAVLYLDEDRLLNLNFTFEDETSVEIAEHRLLVNLVGKTFGQCLFIHLNCFAINIAVLKYFFNCLYWQYRD